MSAIRPVSGVKRTSATDCLTIEIYEYTPLDESHHETNRTMVAKRKPTIETLSKLGKRKLAELLIAGAAGNCQLTQTLNFAISAEEGPAALGASLSKRLATLAKSRSMLSYEGMLTPYAHQPFSVWHFRDIIRSKKDFRFRGKSGRAADITPKAEVDPKRTLSLMPDLVLPCRPARV
jgi:hypothetical protein